MNLLYIYIELRVYLATILKISVTWPLYNNLCLFRYIYLVLFIM